jgi:mono/diheme cytochrome c family protein
VGLCGLLLLGATRGAIGQDRPCGVTDSAVALGRTLYAGKGQCAGCHGVRGEGTAEAEPLISGVWKLGSGSYDWLVHVTRHSGIAARGRDGDPLPMRGPTLLSADEVTAVAAYVWTISRGRAAAASKER